jgi:hypothetical protein
MNEVDYQKIKCFHVIRGEDGNKGESMLDMHNRVSLRYRIEYEDGSIEDLEDVE